MLRVLWLWAIILGLLQGTRLGAYGSGWFYQLVCIIPDILFIVFALIPLIAVPFRNKVPLRRKLLPIALSVVPAALISFPVVNRLGQPEAADIKVLDLNMEHGLEEIERVAALIERENPDILFLQEAGPLGLSPVNPSLARALAPYQMHKSVFEVIAVRGRILEHSIIDIPEMPHEQNELDQKVITAAVAEVKGVRLNLYTAHFSPGHTGRYGLSKLIWQLGRLSDVRRAQFSALSGLANANLPSIAAGDLNEQPFGPNYYGLTEYWTDAFEAAGQGFGYTLTATLPNHCSDYILSRGIHPVRCEVLPDVVSNHRAVVAWFRR